MSFRNQRWLGPVFLTLLLGACGGGNSLLASSGGTGGTGMSGGTGGSGMSIGSITQFGSVFVNGVEYHISGAAISTENGTQLATGMVVAVDYANGTTATSVTFTDNLQGTVDSNTVNAHSGTVRLVGLGQYVIVGKDTVLAGDAGLVVGDRPALGTGPQGDIELVFGDIDAYENGRGHGVLLFSLWGPALQDAGSFGPGNCSGSSEDGRDDLAEQRSPTT